MHFDVLNPNIVVSCPNLTACLRNSAIFDFLHSGELDVASCTRHHPGVQGSLGHSVGTNEATMAPTPENAPCWQEITRPREICIQLEIRISCDWVPLPSERCLFPCRHSCSLVHPVLALASGRSCLLGTGPSILSLSGIGNGVWPKGCCLVRPAYYTLVVYMQSVNSICCKKQCSIAPEGVVSR